MKARMTVPPPAPWHGHASFHIWAAYSFSPNATWGQICAEFVSASKKVEELKTFTNTVLGECWVDRGEAPEWERLYKQRESYPVGTCPLGALFLTVGVDVQKDRLVYEVVGWGRGKESWSIDAGVIPGDTATTEPWAEINALLDRAYASESGVSLHIKMLAVDSGYNTQVVYNWARGHAMSKVIAVKGMDSVSVLISAPRPVDVSAAGRLVREPCTPSRRT
jgi:phage terminase large subunit GpA-like protein